MGYIIALAVLSLSVDAGELRVGTYNIKHGAGMDGKVDLDRQAEVLRKLDVELIALQEVDKNCKRSGEVDQAAYLAEKLGMHHVFGKAINLGVGEYGQAILSKYPIKSHKVLPLPSVGEQRIVVIAEVEVPSLGDTLFCSVHYSFRSEKERFPQVQTLEKELKDVRTPIILTGDFNARPETKTMQFYDANWKIIPKKGDRLTSPAGKPTSEIDFCVVKNFRYKRAATKVIDEPVASDHRPLLTLIEW
jgi:endonuclease/exonuclease/phosphatase family metal-dependent hydrolase